MIKAALLLLLLFLYWNLSAQVVCFATDSTESGYLPFSKAGFGIESPDCIHKSFGEHITQIFDNKLQRNVFVFHSHIVEDNDRCKVFDRVRMEVKGGPNTDEELQHSKNSTSYYRWKFKIDEEFKGASSFCHIFQNKGYGGTDVAPPILTITIRNDKIEVKHRGGNSGTSLGKLIQKNLSLFKGKWVEGYLKQVHDDHGKLELTLRDIMSGDTLLEYKNADIDLWREGASYNRPKWGIYRMKEDILKDEIIKFADFCISEVDSSLCPSEAGNMINIYNTSISSTNIALYPNPTNDKLHIELEKNDNAILTIFNLNGIQVNKPLLINSEKTINLSRLDKGFYIIKIELKNGIISFNKIVLK